MKSLSALAMTTIVSVAGSMAVATSSASDSQWMTFAQAQPPAARPGPRVPPAFNPAPAPVDQAVERQKLRQIMNNSTSQGSNRYARLSSQGNTCIPGETTTLHGQASINLHSPKNVKKTNQYNEEALFSPDASWVVSSAQKHVITAGNPYSSTVTVVPGNFSFAAAQASQQILSSMSSFIASLDIPDYLKADLNLEMQSLVNNYASYSSSLQSSHSMVKHNATVWGTGRTNTSQGHSWYEGDVTVTVKCAPVMLRDANQMINQLKNWTSGVVNCYKSPATCGRG